MAAVTYDPPEVVQAAKEADVAHVTGVNIRAPENGNGETVTIYWEMRNGGEVVKTGAHTVDGAMWGDRHPNDGGTPAAGETYRTHVRFLAYKTLMVDGIIPEAPIT